MLVLGVVLIVVAIILGVFGFVGTALTWLLYIGVGIAVVALVLIVLDRRGAGRRQL